MPPFPSGSLSDLARSPWVQGPAAFLLWVAFFLIVQRIVFGAMRRVAARTHWTWDAVLVRALSLPLRIAIVASGLLVLERILTLSPAWDRALDVTLALAIVVALVLFVDRGARGLLDRLAARSAELQGARGLIQGSVRGVAAGLGLLIFLDSIGISITPILASLGVGSLAVALALQDTLANFFAGLYMIADKPIEAGHFIRLEGGEQGFVTRLGWRSTWIRTPNDSVVVVPNSKLAGSVITNFNLPRKGFSLGIDLGVAYDSDLDTVERVTLEVARDVSRTVEGSVPGSEPAVAFQAFGDSGLRLSVSLHVADFAAGNLVRHEFVKRLTARYRREGIVIPYPTRTLELAAGAISGAALSPSIPAEPRGPARPERGPEGRAPAGR